MDLEDYFEGRQARHKLTDEEVRSLRKEYKPKRMSPDGKTVLDPGNLGEMVRKYKVCKRTIWNCVQGITYSWVTERRPWSPVPYGYVSKEMAKKIRAEYKPFQIGLVKSMCEKYNLHRNTIYKILRNEIHTDV